MVRARVSWETFKVFPSIMPEIRNVFCSFCVGIQEIFLGVCFV